MCTQHASFWKHHTATRKSELVEHPDSALLLLHVQLFLLKFGLTPEAEHCSSLLVKKGNSVEIKKSLLLETGARANPCFSPFCRIIQLIEVPRTTSAFLDSSGLYYIHPCACPREARCVCLATGAWREQHEPVLGARIGGSSKLLAGSTGQDKAALSELTVRTASSY